MLGRHRRPTVEAAPTFDVQTAVANCRTAIRRIGRAMDLCDQQEVAAWRLLAAEQGRTIELDDMVIRLQRGQIAARKGVAR